MDEWMDIWIMNGYNGWMNGYKDEWMDIWINEWI